MDVEDFISSYIDNMSLEQLRDYVKRGRQFALMGIDNLNARWVESFNAWAISRDSNGQEWEDIAAEFTFRGLRPPFDLVKGAFESLRVDWKDSAHLWRGSEEFKAEIERLHSEFTRKPRNQR
jgi:hypothetical protein